MQVLSLLNADRPDLSSLMDRLIDKSLNSGFNGEVFSLRSSDTRVMKVSILFDLDEKKSLTDSYQEVKSNLDFLLKFKPSHFVKLHEHGMLSFIPDKNIIYYYIMDKLNPLSEDENKVFHTLVSHEDRNLKKEIPLDKARPLLEAMSKGLDFNIEKVFSLYQEICNSQIHHLDMHERNIMKDHNGNFKMIDVDNIRIKL